MSELRKDPIIQRWVIIASERGARPADFQLEESEIESRACPLCEGNESKTPPEILALRRDGTPPDAVGWDVRVVPNKFPALSIEGKLDHRGLGMFDLMNGIGAHEVIVESPDHNLNLATASLEQIESILRTYIHRLTDLIRDPRLAYLLVFRNYGKAAGASLSHPHSQLIALPIVPQIVKEELIAARAYYKQRDRCVFCDLIYQEQRFNERVVYSSEHHIVLAPFASRFPFELHLFPRRHCHDFTCMNDEERRDLAIVLREVLGAVQRSLNNPPYNYVIHTTPNLVPRPGHPEYWQTIEFDYHWHIEFIPRLTRVAGFEWGTGFYINPVSPESATQVLRTALSEAMVAQTALVSRGESA